MVDYSLFRLALLEQAREHLGAVVPKGHLGGSGYNGMGQYFENEYGDGGFCADAVISWIHGIAEQSGLDPDIPQGLGLGHGTARLHEYALENDALRDGALQDPNIWQPGDVIIMSQDPNTPEGTTERFNGHTAMVLDVTPDPNNPGSYRITTIDANHKDNWSSGASSVVVEHYVFTPGESNLMLFTDEDWEAGPESSYRRYAMGVINVDELPQSQEISAVIAQEGFRPTEPVEGYHTRVHERNTPRFDAAMEQSGVNLSIVPERPEPPQTYTVQQLGGELNRSETMALQALLIEQFPAEATRVGNSAGNPDGIWGGGSRAIMERFLTSEPPTGLGQSDATISQETLERISELAQQRLSSGDLDNEALTTINTALAALGDLDGITPVQTVTEIPLEPQQTLAEAMEDAREAVREAADNAGSDPQDQIDAAQRAMMNYSANSIGVNMNADSTQHEIEIARAQFQAAVLEYQTIQRELQAALEASQTPPDVTTVAPAMPLQPEITDENIILPETDPTITRVDPPTLEEPAVITAPEIDTSPPDLPNEQPQATDTAPDANTIAPPQLTIPEVDTAPVILPDNDTIIEPVQPVAPAEPIIPTTPDIDMTVPELSSDQIAPEQEPEETPPYVNTVPPAMPEQPITEDTAPVITPNVDGSIERTEPPVLEAPAIGVIPEIDTTLPEMSEEEVAEPEYHVHRIVRGDTISELAVQYGVTQNEIRDANGIPHDSDLIIAGKDLNIPVVGEEVAPVAEPQIVAPNVEEPEIQPHREPYRPDLAITDLFDGLAQPNDLDINGRAILEAYQGLNGVPGEALGRAAQSGLLNVKYQGIRDFAQHLLTEIGGDGIRVTPETQAQGVALLEWSAEMGNAQAVRDLALIHYNGLESAGIETSPEQGYMMMRNLVDALETRRTEALAEVDNYKWTQADRAALESAQEIIEYWENTNPELEETYQANNGSRLATEGATFGVSI